MRKALLLATLVLTALILSAGTAGALPRWDNCGTPKAEPDCPTTTTKAEETTTTTKAEETTTTTAAEETTTTTKPAETTTTTAAGDTTTTTAAAATTTTAARRALGTLARTGPDDQTMSRLLAAGFGLSAVGAVALAWRRRHYATR